MESVKMKKATKTVAFRQLAIYCNIVDNQLLTVYIITVIKVKLRVETFLFLLASKNSVIGNFRITEF